MPPKLPSSFLGVTKRQNNQDVPVTEIELDHGTESGIHWQMIGVDMVPLQEEHEARLERGIGLEEWGRLPLMEKAMIVAVRRNRIATENIQAEAEIRRAERKARRK